MRVPRSWLPALFGMVALAASAQVDLDAQLRQLQEQAAALDQQQAELKGRTDEVKLAIIHRDLERWGLPALAPGQEVVWHPAHALVYSERDEQPLWVAHIVMPDVARGNLARIDSFQVDPKVKTGTASTEDYWNSGYDRGHLAPSADMRWNHDALFASYYYSNISPQLPEFNRGSWADLEDWVRRSVIFGGHRLFVVTGPVLEAGLPKMNNPGHKHEVSIPKYFFKALVDLDAPEKKGIAFLMKNGTNEYPTISYAVPIDSVEKITGLDLFPALDDATEARIEAQRDPKVWYGPGDPYLGETEPMKAPLPKGMFNTVQAHYHVGNMATICGTVVSTRKTAKAKAIYLNFDRLHPHQDFYATIWEYNGPNFSYDPETYLVNKQVCVTGKITLYEDIPRISINNEKEIQLFEEAIR